jgi:nitrite reductase (NADH) small subunit
MRFKGYIEMTELNLVPNEKWEAVCTEADLVANSGICALVQGQQVAIYYLPNENPSIYALSNWDPIGEANVMSRGIIGSLSDELMVASPLYKQHYSLTSGQCLEDETQQLTVYPTQSSDGKVSIQISA